MVELSDFSRKATRMSMSLLPLDAVAVRETVERRSIVCRVLGFFSLPWALDISLTPVSSFPDLSMKKALISQLAPTLCLSQHIKRWTMPQQLGRNRPEGCQQVGCGRNKSPVNVAT